MFSSLLLFLSLNQAEGAKTVWVNSYTRSDGSSVQGHFRSPPSGGIALTGHTPVIAYSSQDPKGSSNADVLQFERGFVDGNPYVRLINNGDGQGYLELYCVKTAEGVIENVEWVYDVAYDKTVRWSLDKVDVWIGKGTDYKISSGVTIPKMIYNCHYGCKDDATLYGVQGSVDGHVFRFQPIMSKNVTEFYKGCQHLKIAE